MGPSSADVSAAASDGRSWYETSQGQRIGIFAAGALGTITLVLVCWVVFLRPPAETARAQAVVDVQEMEAVTDRFAGTFGGEPVYFALTVARDGGVAGTVERLGTRVSGVGSVSPTGFSFVEEGTGYAWNGALVEGTIRGQVTLQGAAQGPFAVRP